uniref:RNase H type-1 domain-containing protein n=1 Tax=Gopherus evgoodei TaxID=1825980 RepID=A0A8C4VFS8_9SAUR
PDADRGCPKHSPPRAYLYTDSWAIYKGLRAWLTAWEAKGWELAGRPLWGTTLWQQLLAYAQQAPLAVRHVDAHTKAQTNEARWNVAANDMARGEVLQLAKRYHVEGGHCGARATQYTALRQGTALPLSACRTARAGCPTCSQLAPIPLLEPAGRIHRAMGLCQDWQVDYIGPLPQEWRWQYVFTAVDTYTGLMFSLGGSRPSFCASPCLPKYWYSYGWTLSIHLGSWMQSRG